MANTQHISPSKNFNEKEFPDNISMNTLMSNKNSFMANNQASSITSNDTDYLDLNDDIGPEDINVNTPQAFGNTGLKSFKKKMKGINVNSTQQTDFSKPKSLRETCTSLDENNKNQMNMPVDIAPLPKIEEKLDESELDNTFERMKNMNPANMERQQDQSYISIIEEKSVAQFKDYEEHAYTKRMTEKYRKNQEFDLTEIADERDRISAMLFREREIKRVFEKEVGKQKKDLKALKTENDKINNLGKEHDLVVQQKNLDDNRFDNINDNNDALEKMDYEILIMKEQEKSLGNFVFLIFFRKKNKGI